MVVNSCNVRISANKTRWTNVSRLPINIAVWSQFLMKNHLKSMVLREIYAQHYVDSSGQSLTVSIQSRGYNILSTMCFENIVFNSFVLWKKLCQRFVNDSNLFVNIFCSSWADLRWICAKSRKSLMFRAKKYFLSMICGIFLLQFAILVY